MNNGLSGLSRLPLHNLRKTMYYYSVNKSKKEKPVKQDYDSPWKQIIEELLESFLEFFFPLLHKDIDFSKGYEIKSKELYKLLKDQEIGKRYTDELIKVYLKNGAERWLLIHIEVQGYKEEDFARRMFIYYYRIFDRYNHNVISLVVFTDSDKTYRPDTFLWEGWGFEHRLKFPLIKIIDYKNKVAEFEQSNNPMAIVVLAQLKSLEVKKGKTKETYNAKLTLIRMLFKRGYNKNQIMQIFSFIDWLLMLPENLEGKITSEIIKLEEEEKMTYVTHLERIAEKRGKKIGEKRGEKRGEKKREISIVKNMLKKGYTINDITEITGLTEEEILAIKEEID